MDKTSLFLAVTLAKQIGTFESKERVRHAFEKLESSLPTPENLLDTEQAALLDGSWDLLYTIAADVSPETGEDPTRGEYGKVNAGGIRLSTTDEGAQTTQAFDLENGRISNTVTKPFLTSRGTPLFYTMTKVSGPFSRSPVSGRRADVAFDTLEFGIGTYRFTLDWFFPLLYTIKGPEETLSWLETTHLSDDLRLGRGNKGSIFILARPDLQ
eukprot:CAMPEP_0172637802 /NCGR_PEP_ID=MMETSP1068-20121228/210762_1 /TAXON_ID=35684 /ORGANISM="Pseudopedinella elastica, Strain CCMP716" /LENGTH=211 /DNA_ID=CAMNT_0013450543 /DNA_START=306 /DNA_END=941 /DNA_ORIENTATION=+